MRTAAITGALAVSFALAACGADDTPKQRTPAHVRLQISSPTDLATVNGDSVEVHGRVVPATARVRVGGRAARVSGGVFSAQVPLDRGSNVIDVAASARGRLAAFTALRIARQDLVRVPDLAGTHADEAVETLETLGLKVKTTRGGGLFDHILPTAVAVCDQEPEAGSDVEPGATVRLLVARSC